MCGRSTVAAPAAIIAVSAAVELGATGAIAGLTAEAARIATTTGTGLQHGVRHVNEALGLGNWNFASREAFRAIVEDVLTDPDAVVQNWTMSKGGQVVDIFIKEVDGQTLAVYVSKAGAMITSVIASASQLQNWG